MIHETYIPPAYIATVRTYTVRAKKLSMCNLFLDNLGLFSIPMINFW